MSELHEDLPPITADRIQLQQVLINLVMNGIDAMQEVKDRKPTLTVRTGLSDTEVQATVSDCGVGLDSEKAELIFKPFETTKANGMGMGLAISRSIVESHGGKLWAEPNSDYGARFNFTLPISVEEAS